MAGTFRACSEKVARRSRPLCGLYCTLAVPPSTHVSDSLQCWIRYSACRQDLWSLSTSSAAAELGGIWANFVTVQQIKAARVVFSQVNELALCVDTEIHSETTKAGEVGNDRIDAKEPERTVLFQRGYGDDSH